MNILKRHIGSWLLRTVGLLFGGLLLALCIPSQTPWQSAHLQCSGMVWEMVRVSFPWAGAEFGARGTTLLSILALSLVLLGAVSETIRSFVRTQGRARFVLLIGLFLLPLIPTREGLPIILQLAFAGTGMLWLLWGLWPALNGIVSRSPWLSRGCSAAVAHFEGMPAVWFVALLFGVTFGIANFVSWRVFEHVPHIQDNVDQLFHAKMFAGGQLKASSPPLAEFFEQQHMISNGSWYSQYPPGHTFLLMLGVLVGVPWIVNPLLGAGAVLMFYFIGRKMFGETVGRLAALLGILSPFLIFLSSEFFSHASSLFFLSVFVYYFIDVANNAGGWRSALYAGLAAGMALITRPYTTFGFALPFVAYSGWLMLRDPRLWSRKIVVLGGGAMAFVAILLVYNWQTTGHPLLSGYEVLYGKQHNPGFGHSGWGPPHTPLKGLRQVWNDLNALGKYLFEWPLPSTVFVIFCFLRRPTAVWTGLLLAAALSLPLVHFFYWYQEWCFGPRLEYEMILPLVLLSAKGMVEANKIFAGHSPTNDAQAKPNRVVLVVVTCIVYALGCNVPALARHYADKYWDVSNVIVRTVEKQRISNALIFVQSNFSAVFAANTPSLDGPVVYARDLGIENRKLMKLYPGRHYYLADSTFLAEIPGDYYDDLQFPVASNSNFEQGTLDGWMYRGDAWGVADFKRPGGEGRYHAESLGGGPSATGELRTADFMIEGRQIRFLKNGWNVNPEKPNQYLLVDAVNGEALRTAFPPNQDGFVPHIWDVADLQGRLVYLLVQDNDDDSVNKDGNAWLGIDSVSMGDGR